MTIRGKQMKGSISGEHREILCNMRTGLMKSMPYSDEDLNRPLVAVIHAWSDVSPGEYHLRYIAEYVKAGIREGGGTPAELIIPGVCGGVSGAGTDVHKFNVPYRDIAAALVEIMLNMNHFDAAVVMAACDHVIPAFLMGVCLADIPSIMLTGGYMEPGDDFDGHYLHATATMKLYGKYKEGKITRKQLKHVVDRACPGPGACVEMATAHTMASISEALGMSLPGNTGVAATSTDLIKLARLAGRQVMALHEAGITPKDIITKKSIENAMRTVLAVGGSANGLIHLPAITRQVDIHLSWDWWEELSRTTPFICSILPNNPEFNMKDFDRAGRTRAVMKELAPLLNLDVLTVTGNNMGENISGAVVHDRRIIRPLSDPFTPDGGIVVMKGNLAPDGGILKKSACPENLFKHRGPARVFDEDKYAIDALLNGKIRPGDFIVARFEGPRGCPGARKITVLMHTIVSVGLTDSVVLLTDGGFSGTNFGAGIGYISPEAGVGGPLAVVRDGDEIEMDVERRSLNLVIDEKEIKRRLESWTPPSPRVTKGTLGLYARYASSHATGAYIL